MDSHRRLDLAAQFQAIKLDIIGLQDTRLRKPRALAVGEYIVFAAAAATPKGQGGVEIWIRTTLFLAARSNR
jgi:exonuclease III